MESMYVTDDRLPYPLKVRLYRCTQGSYCPDPLLLISDYGPVL